MMNPANSINSFMNKSFGVPLPKKKVPIVGALVDQPQKPSIPARNDLQANNAYPATPANNEAKGTPYTTSASPASVNPSLKSPAAQGYMNSKLNGNATTATPSQNAYDPLSGARTAYGATIGAADMLGGKPVTTGSSTTATSGNSTGTGTSTDATTGTTAKTSAYMQYLKNQFSPEVLDQSQSDYQKAAKRLADIQSNEDAVSTSGRHAAEDAFDAQGGTVAGAQQASSGITRKTNRELADLATQEGAAARTAGVYQDVYKNSLDAGKTEYQAQQDAAELSKPINVDGVLYAPQGDGTYKAVAGNQKLDTSVVEANGKKILINNQTGATIKTLGSSGSSSTTGTAGAYVEGANPTVDSWASRIQSGQNKITDIPASQAGLRNQVAVALEAMGNSADGKPTTTELGKAALGTANSLLDKLTSGKGTSAVGRSGLLDSFGYGLIPGTDRANFVTDFNSLKSQLSLEGVKYLKGQGQVSDSERALLAQAVTKLSLSQSEDEFKSTLDGIISKLQGGSTASTSSSTSQSIPKGTDGSSYGFPGYVSDGNQWVLK